MGLGKQEKEFLYEYGFVLIFVRTAIASYENNKNDRTKENNDKCDKKFPAISFPRILLELLEYDNDGSSTKSNINNQELSTVDLLAAWYNELNEIDLKAFGDILRLKKLKEFGNISSGKSKWLNRFSQLYSRIDILNSESYQMKIHININRLHDLLSLKQLMLFKKSAINLNCSKSFARISNLEIFELLDNKMLKKRLCEYNEYFGMTLLTYKK